MKRIKLTDYSDIYYSNKRDLVIYVEDGVEHLVHKSVMESMLFDYCKRRGDDMGE